MALQYRTLGFDREVPLSDKTLMRIPSLALYFHVICSWKQQ
jgi:hypothetical protein